LQSLYVEPFVAYVYVQILIGLTLIFVQSLLGLTTRSEPHSFDVNICSERF